jgi:hypothetical protein
MTMKFSVSLALIALAGCAVAERPVPAAAGPTDESRAFVDRLRVDTSWHPPSSGGQVLSCSYELPEGAYTAQGWPCYYYSRSCEWERPVRWTRSCRPTVNESAPRFR